MGPAETLQFHQIILEQTDRIRGLISDLLDAARIKTGTLSVDPHPVKVADLVNEARNTFLSAGGRGNFSIDIAPDLPPVIADRRRIAQVICILLANAIRRSLDSSDIKVATTREEFHVAVSIAYKGNSVPRDMWAHLFWKCSRFTRKHEHAVAFRALLRRKGIKVVSITEHADDSPTGKLMEAIIESVALPAYNPAAAGKLTG